MINLKTIIKENTNNKPNKIVVIQAADITPKIGTKKYNNIISSKNNTTPNIPVILYLPVLHKALTKTLNKEKKE